MSSPGRPGSPGPEAAPSLLHVSLYRRAGAAQPPSLGVSSSDESSDGLTAAPSPAASSRDGRPKIPGLSVDLVRLKPPEEAAEESSASDASDFAPASPRTPRPRREHPPRAPLQPNQLVPVPKGRRMADFHAKYQLGDVLGRGAYGEVSDCTEVKSGSSFACKMMQKEHLPSAIDLMRVRMEFELQRRLAGHSHIVQVSELYEDDACFRLVMEKCPGGDLLDLLDQVSPLREEEAAALFAQVVSAVKFCHQRGVLHRDIKLENVLVSQTTLGELAEGAQGKKDGAANSKGRKQEGWLNVLKRGGRRPRTIELSEKALAVARYIPVIKLSDFGSALPLGAGRKTSGDIGGTTMYQAPEVLKGRRYDYKADMWALGILLYALLSGTFPFKPALESLLSGMIKRGLFDLYGEEWATVSEDARDAVSSLLQMNANKRPTILEFCSHPWLLRHGHRL